MERRFTAVEKDVIVREYLAVPYGEKVRWVAERGLDQRAVNKWRQAFLVRELEAGFRPRDTSSMDPISDARVAQLQRQLLAERAAREQDKQRHEDEVARLQAVNDALGKAIGLLHDHAAKQEPTDDT